MGDRRGPPVVEQSVLHPRGDRALQLPLRAVISPIGPFLDEAGLQRPRLHLGRLDGHLDGDAPVLRRLLVRDHARSPLVFLFAMAAISLMRFTWLTPLVPGSNSIDAMLAPGHAARRSRITPLPDDMARQAAERARVHDVVDARLQKKAHPARKRPAGTEGEGFGNVARARALQIGIRRAARNRPRRAPQKRAQLVDAIEESARKTASVQHVRQLRR